MTHYDYTQHLCEETIKKIGVGGVEKANSVVDFISNIKDL